MFLTYTIAGFLVVIVLFLAGFFVAESWKRSRQRSVTDLEQLRPRKESARETLIVDAAPTQAIDAVADYLEEQKLGARISLQTESQLIAFTGSAGGANFKGMLFIPPMQMPMRIAARAIPEGERTRLELLLDEDFGFQIFLGPARRAFKEKYAEAFGRIVAELKGKLQA